MVDRRIATARSAAEQFSARLNEEDTFSERLAYEYNVARQALAASFQGLSRDALDLSTYALDDVKRRIAAHMRTMFAGRVDSALLTVNGYGEVHSLVYALLAEKVGESVPAWRVRLLTADAIHSERRTRELRDLGLDIETSERGRTPVYRLTSLQPDLAYGAAYQLRKNVTQPNSVHDAERHHIVQLAESSANLPKKRGVA